MSAARSTSTDRVLSSGEQNVIEFNSARILTHDPHTGRARDERDIASDPEGALIVEAGSPLYAAPSSPRAASPEPARVALTEDQIDNAWINRPGIHGGELMPQLYDLVRAVEIHHGIGIAAEKKKPKS